MDFKRIIMDYERIRKKNICIEVRFKCTDTTFSMLISNSVLFFLFAN